MIEFPKESYEYYYKNGVFESVFEWIINSKYRTAVFLPTWIKEQVDNPSENLLALAKTFDTSKDDNVKVINILRWIKDNVKYVGDNTKYKTPEYWQTAEETFNLKTGDCEDGGIFIYVLCRLAGVPEYKLKVGTATVTGGGHAFCMYFPQPHFMTFLDFCYWYDSRNVDTRSKYFIVNKTIYGDSQTNYKELWFAFSEDRLLTGFKKTYIPDKKT